MSAPWAVATPGTSKLFRMNDDFIEVGCITKAHGIRGEVCIDYNADSPDLLHDAVYLAPAAQSPPKAYKLLKMRLHHGRPLLSLEGVADRNAAELLRGQRVFIPASRLPELADDEVYLRDLPGLTVFTRAAGGDAVPLGSISRVDVQAGQELWTITTPDGQEVLFPATEDFVEAINLEEGSVIIAPPPGLLEVYLAP